MRAAFKPFVYGVIFTTVTWTLVLYLYFCFNPVTNNSPYVPTPHQIGRGDSQTKVLTDQSIKQLVDSTWKEKKKNMPQDNTNTDLGLVKTKEDQKIREMGYKDYAFNVLVSLRLDYHREIPDTRNKLCHIQNYSKVLLNASVIICFYNEEKNTLYRTLHSVLDRTPSHLLHEILLVNDFSDNGLSDDEINHYIFENLNPKVKLFSTKRREGLIRARVYGAKQATGQVLVFLDSHCEVNQQWLEPLLNRIQTNHTFVVTPIIDIINSDTFQYTPSPLVRGGFNWGLHFKWDSLPEQTLSKPEDFVKPIRSPTMAGGLFAIDREYFFDIGEYDAGMNVWGGENLEISFRIWMCGGRLEIMPCSRVGHIFRRRRPYGSPDGEDTMTYNSLRGAHVWLDEYIEYYFQVRPDARNAKYGDVGPRKRLRSLMKCHSFAWYLENVYPELQIPGNKSSTDSKVGIGKVDSRRQGLARKRYRTKNFVAKYQIRISGSSLCLQSEQDVTTKGSSLVAARCSRGTKRQMWHESDRNELVLAELLCLESPEGSLSSQKPHLAKCHEMGGLQDWKHTGEIDTPIYNTAAGLCLGVDVSVNELPGFIAENTHIVMTLCSESTATKWDFIHV